MVFTLKEEGEFAFCVVPLGHAWYKQYKQNKEQGGEWSARRTLNWFKRGGKLTLRLLCILVFVFNSPS